LAAYRTTKTTLLLENLILLLLRILVIALLVIVFARPIMQVISPQQDTKPKDNYILVLDNSYSMGLRGPSTSALENAKVQGRSIINKAQENDRISLLTMNERPEIIADGSITSEKQRESLLRDWNNIKVTDFGCDLKRSLELLQDVVQKSEYSQKRIAILTDLQKITWEKALQSPPILEILRTIRKQAAEFNIVDMGHPNPQNIGITSLSLDGVAIIGTPSRFVVTIQNYGTNTYPQIPVLFSIDGQKQKTEYITLGAHQEVDVSFFPTLIHPGNHYATVELAPDPLAADNLRHLSFQALEQVKILVVDGDPRPGPFESESDYFMAALGDSGQSFFKITKVLATELGPKILLQEYDVVVLANVANLEYLLLNQANRKPMLQNFLERGSGLWIWLGDKITADYYNEELYDFKEILPGRLEKTLGNSSMDREVTVYVLDEIANHPIWRYFLENPELMEDLKKCFVYKFFVVQSGQEPGQTPEASTEQTKKTTTVLARYRPSNLPAIIERKFGKGKVLLSTTTLDREWSNFHTDQYGHVFVVMLHEFLQYLVAQPYLENNLLVGQTFTKYFDFYIEEKSLRATTPQNEIASVLWKTLDKGYQIAYSNTQQSGVYRILMTIPAQVIQEKPELMRFLNLPEKTEPGQILDAGYPVQEYLVVNVVAEEGNVVCLSQQELSQKFSELDMQIHKDLVLQVKAAPKKNIEYWQYILATLLVLSMLESFLAMWFGKYTK